MLVSTIIVTVAFLLILLPIIPVISGKFNDSKKAKRRLCYNLCGFGAVILCSVFVPFIALAEPSAAAETAGAVVQSGLSDKALYALASALAVGLAGLGGGLAVGPAASAAIGAMAEDPTTFGKSLIFVALGEGIAIYGLLVAFLILFVF